MRLDADDVQIARHSMGMMAEHAKLLDSALEEVGIERGLREQMVLAWWQILVSSAMAPNFKDMLEGFLGTQAEDEDA